MSSKLHLIGAPLSTCTKRVLMTLHELNVSDFTLYTPDMKAEEHKQPAHIAKQPFGSIPVLEDGDLTLYESRAICRYLAAKYSGQGTRLIPDPKDLKAVALFEQWASVEYSDFDAFATDLVGQKLFGRMRGRDPIPEVVQHLTKKLSEKLDIYDSILAKQKYMGGDEFSLIDIFYMPYTEKLWTVGDGNLIDSRPNVKAWWERVSARESWKHEWDPEAKKAWKANVERLESLGWFSPAA